MKKLFKYLKPYMLPTLLAPLFMLLEVAMDLMQPALMSRVIDVGVANADKAYIVRTCVLMFVCALLGVTGGLGNMYFSTRAGYGFARDLRSDLPAPILRTDVLEIKDLKPGMVLTGTVRNVIDFGVFVDIGVHQDGLVHISQVCNKFIKHPSEAVAVGDVVKVVVLDVDEKKHRISLSMKQVPKE